MHLLPSFIQRKRPRLLPWRHTAVFARFLPELTKLLLFVLEFVCHAGKVMKQKKSESLTRRRWKIVEAGLQRTLIQYATAIPWYTVQMGPHDKVDDTHEQVKGEETTRIHSPTPSATNRRFARRVSHPLFIFRMTAQRCTPHLRFRMANFVGNSKGSLKFAPAPPQGKQ